MPHPVPFRRRHIGPSPEQEQHMLDTIKVETREKLIWETIPDDILQDKPLDLPPAMSEAQILAKAREFGSKNKLFKSYIGMGYYGCHTPAVIQRSVLENPNWYTAYTPYQPEISQGRLEALINFQTMVTDLTGMEISNASLLDEGTAVAEAVTMAYGISRQKKEKVLVLEPMFPQSKAVLTTRCDAMGIEIEWADKLPKDLSTYVAVVTQYPDAHGEIGDVETIIKTAQDQSCLTIMVADVLSLCLLKPPGDLGADIAVGSTQRFGVPMGFGGPHAAYLATKEKYKRLIPGRIVGVSKDTHDRHAYRLALQTREQHIRREKATSNICTAQVLLANIAGFYAVYHGPKRLKQIAEAVHTKTVHLMDALKNMGWNLKTENVFDTLMVEVTTEQRDKIQTIAEKREMNFNYFFDGYVGISIDEITELGDLEQVAQVFAEIKGKTAPSFQKITETSRLPKNLVRTSAYLTHPTFNRFQSETELLRYITRLQRRDLTLADSMIPLGSCTMKLNAAAELMPITWPEYTSIHPFAPLCQAQGYVELIGELQTFLKEITGFHDISLQPNAGSQGEYAGLLAIRRYHEANGNSQRNICLIPSSAHGTNPASAVMAGMKTLIVKCDENGNVDLEDLEAKATEHKDDLAALMITYPSTHGVFETHIRKICDLVHSNGGQVYMDGANLNAMVGLCQPGKFGPDVCHLNLHKTFCIPHGGGGPGVGPIGVVKHLAPYIPNHNLVKEAGPETGIPNISAAPWGSALILPISWSYIRLMGEQGLRESTEMAIMNANYIASKLDGHYKVLFTGDKDRVAHECIIDLRPLKENTGIDVNDVAKRLIDYGFHAPTMSWPVINTMMIEPTESEGLEELDRFCDAMIQIRKEIAKVEKGEWPKDNNPLVNAPHTTADLMAKWEYPYSTQEACYPNDWVKEKKFWVHVNRIDNAYGDKNLFCSCPPVE